MVMVIHQRQGSTMDLIDLRWMVDIIA